MTTLAPDRTGPAAGPEAGPAAGPATGPAIGLAAGPQTPDRAHGACGRAGPERRVCSQRRRHPGLAAPQGGRGLDERPDRGDRGDHRGDRGGDGRADLARPGDLGDQRAQAVRAMVPGVPARLALRALPRPAGQGAVERVRAQPAPARLGPAVAPAGAPGGVRVLPGVGEGPARPRGRQHLPAEVRGLLRAPDHQHRPGRELPGQERVAVPGVPGDRGVRRRLGRGAVGHPVRHRPVRPVGRAEVRVPRRLRLRDQHAHPPLLPERPAPERLRHRGVPDHPGAAHRHRAAPGTGWRHRGHRAGRARRRLRRRLLPAGRPAGPAAGDVPGPALVRPAGHLGIPARPARRVQPVVRGAAHRRGRRGHAEPHHDEPRRRDPAHPGPGRRWWTGPTRPSC